jgi:hypothetical protein
MDSMEIFLEFKSIAFKDIGVDEIVNSDELNYERWNFYKTILLSPPKGKSSTTSSCPILQGRKAAKADGCSGAIEGACSFFFLLQLGGSG